MTMMDCVELTAEKENYAKYGVHKGMQGWICLDDSANGTWLVNFPQCGEEDDIAEISVNEAIKAQFDALEKTSKSFSGQDNLSDYMV